MSSSKGYCVPSASFAAVEEELRVNELAVEISVELGPRPGAGACWVSMSDDTEVCHRDLDAEGCASLQMRARLKTTFYRERFCP